MEPDWSDPALQSAVFEDIIVRIEELEADGLIKINVKAYKLPPMGRPFCGISVWPLMLVTGKSTRRKIVQSSNIAANFSFHNKWF